MPGLAESAVLFAGVLFAPGPTNALVATAGAALGLKKAVPLAFVAIAAYLIGLALFLTIIGPTISAFPGLGTVLRVALSLYLLFLAWNIWVSAKQPVAQFKPVTAPNVFIATVLNPKILVMGVFAFRPPPELTFDIYGERLLTFTGIGIIALLLWTTLGSALTASDKPSISSTILCRVSAAVLAIFGVSLFGSVIVLST